MAQRELHPKSVLKQESDLRKLFLVWSNRGGPEWRVAGAPSWLRRLGNPLLNHEIEFPTAHGSSFRPDLLFLDGESLLVVELKLAVKYEPIALPEVLHHAWALENDSVAQEKLRTIVSTTVANVVPILITQTRWWLRSSMAYLRQHGLNQGAIRQLEFETFHDGERNLLWVGDPLAEWELAKPNDVPKCLRETFQEYAFWYHVSGEDSWFGMSTLKEVRPPFIQGKFVEAASLEGHSAEYIACEGEFGDRWRYLLLK